MEEEKKKDEQEKKKMEEEKKKQEEMKKMEEEKKKMEEEKKKVEEEKKKVPSCACWPESPCLCLCAQLQTRSRMVVHGVVCAGCEEGGQKGRREGR